MTPPAPPWTLRLPPAPRSIQKGVPVKDVLGPQAVEYLGRNVQSVYPAFNLEGFVSVALHGLEPLGILDRGQHLARALWQHLPQHFENAVKVLLDSQTPPNDGTSELGLAVFFYLPHVCFVARYGLDPAYNQGEDPFEAAMQAQYELTQRFSAEFSIRPFLIEQPDRTLARLQHWTTDPSPHVRRLCSEGTRPRLPWAMRLPAFIKDPTPLMPLLEALKDDPDLYVRRSVANHLGDIAKDHPEWVYAVCERWLHHASNERKWLIRHALRHPAKKGDVVALTLRNRSKP
jgi:3-methyladenine DNA glycosylase AlkC